MSKILRSTTTARGVSYVKEALDTMLNDSDDAGGVALRSLLFKLSLVIPLPFIIAFRIMGFQWADGRMSGGAPVALTSLVEVFFPCVRFQLSSSCALASQNCVSASPSGTCLLSSWVWPTARPRSSRSRGQVCGCHSRDGDCAVRPPVDRCVQRQFRQAMPIFDRGA